MATAQFFVLNEYGNYTSEKLPKRRVCFIPLHKWQALYQRQHGNKLRYKTKAAAEAVATVMEEKSGHPQNSYRCPFCGGWHHGRDSRRA